MSKPLGCDFDLIHVTCLNVVFEPEPLSAGSFCSGASERFHQLLIPNDVQRFLERLQVIETHQNKGWPTVASDHDPVVLDFDSVCQFGQSGLHI